MASLVCLFWKLYTISIETSKYSGNLKCGVLNISGCLFSPGKAWKSTYWWTVNDNLINFSECANRLFQSIATSTFRIIFFFINARVICKIWRKCEKLYSFPEVCTRALPNKNITEASSKTISILAINSEKKYWKKEVPWIII